MNKYFVPYEIALALKELGFDEPCLGCYYKDKTFAYHPDSDADVDAPIYDQVIDWFMEKHNMMLSPFRIQYGNDPALFSFGIINLMNGGEDCGEDFEDFNEARNAGIIKAIELIK